MPGSPSATVMVDLLYVYSRSLLPGTCWPYCGAWENTSQEAAKGQDSRNARNWVLVENGSWVGCVKIDTLFCPSTVLFWELLDKQFFNILQLSWDILHDCAPVSADGLDVPMCGPSGSGAGPAVLHPALLATLGLTSLSVTLSGLDFHLLQK